MQGREGFDCIAVMCYITVMTLWPLCTVEEWVGFVGILIVGRGGFEVGWCVTVED